VGETPSTWDAWPQLRAQQSEALALPNTAEAITIDVGSIDIHPTNKEPVGNRLALLARNLIYGDSIVAQSPRYRRNTLTDSGTVIVKFDLSGSSLIAANGTDSNSLPAFAIADENNQFIWADARITGNEVEVSHPSITEPAFLRYAWEYNPGTVGLYNTAGLPAAPFNVAINPGFVIRWFKSARTAIEEGESTTLSWLVFNAESVFLDGVEVDTLGAEIVSPLETTKYMLTAINRDESTETDTAYVTIEVLAPSLINRTFGKPVTASTYESCCGDPLLPEYATDEDLATRWSSAWSDGTGNNPEEPLYDGDADDEWIAIDFGEYIEVNKIILTWEAAYGSGYNIESSLDGYVWKSEFEERAGDGDEDLLDFETPFPARFIRMQGVERATQFGYSLYEIAAYGELSNIQPPIISLSSAAGILVDASTDSLLITADVADSNGVVESVEFYVDGNAVGTDTEAPFEYKFDLVGNREYVFTAIATDNSNLSIQSAPLNVYTNIGQFKRFEAEATTTTGEISVAQSDAASGGNYLDARDAWTITFPTFYLWEEGEHLINIRYQLTYDSPKSQYLVVNSDTVGTLDFTAPNNTDWLNHAFIYNFEDPNNIEIAIHGLWNWMSIDYMDVEGVNGGLSVEGDTEVPRQVALLQNFPNPFNPNTVIRYQLPVNSTVRIDVFDVTGRLVSTLIDGAMPAGHHSVNFNATSLASGLYFYQLSGSFGTITQKMLLVK
jgi:hypothetical protein